MAVATWTGASSSAWSDGPNWDGGVVCQEGDDLYLTGSTAPTGLITPITVNSFDSSAFTGIVTSAFTANFTIQGVEV